LAELCGVRGDDEKSGAQQSALVVPVALVFVAILTRF
jgi:hypothetical protein